MVRIGIFTSKESYAEWHMREADAIEAHGLRQAREELAKAKQDGCVTFLGWNPHIDEGHKAQAVAGHIKYLEDNVRYLERKVKRYRKMAQKALAEA